MIDLYKLIINPNSGGGMANKYLPEIESVLQQHGCEYRVLIAETPDDATRLARESCTESLEGIIALGGDGTLFQIVNGLAGSSIPLLFASCGTGNDFIKCLHLPTNPVEALKLQLNCPVSRIDVGRMNDIFFLNVSGTGFDVDVLRQVERYKQNSTGLKPYLRALYSAIKNYKPMEATISVDGKPDERVRFAILSIGNGNYIGGGMKAVPDAKPDDGLFDVVIVKPVAKLAILVLIAFYIAGKHVSIGLASVRRCKRITLRCAGGMTLNLDGELRSVDIARYEIFPQALSVRIPKAAEE